MCPRWIASLRLGGSKHVDTRIRALHRIMSIQCYETKILLLKIDVQHQIFVLIKISLEAV